MRMGCLFERSLSAFLTDALSLSLYYSFIIHSELLIFPNHGFGLDWND